MPTTLDTPPTTPATPAAPAAPAVTSPLATAMTICALTFFVLTLLGSISGWQQATPACSDSSDVGWFDSDSYDSDSYDSDSYDGSCGADLLDRLPGITQTAGPWAVAFVGSLIGVSLTAAPRTATTRRYEF